MIGKWTQTISTGVDRKERATFQSRSWVLAFFASSNTAEHWCTSILFALKPPGLSRSHCWYRQATRQTSSIMTIHNEPCIE